MLHFLPAPLLGIISALLYGINTLFWPWVIFLFALLRFIPIKNWQKICNYFLNQVPTYWASVNNFIIRLTTQTKWDIQGTENLNPNDWYLLICNHQTWVDIYILEYVFNRKIPTLKFFMKKELVWTLPVAGLAAKLVDFPILHRHTKEYLAKHPEQKGRDIETTRKACEQFKNTPTTVINFVEGSRFTPAKHQRQNSPYQFLLRPRAGGIAFALAAMEGCFQKILNVTIIYPAGIPNMWNFFCGKVPKIIVKVEVLPITPNIIGDYENNREFRVQFQTWINKIWQAKDQLINDALKKT